jgi:hypothetical protein
MVGTVHAERYAGIGLTLEDVIESHQRSYAECHRQNDEDRENGHELSTAVNLASTSWDYGIWEQDRLLAVLTPHPGGEPRYLVVRIDADALAREGGAV